MMFGCESFAASRASRRKRSRSAGIRRALGRQQLDRDQAIEVHLVREVHDAHATASELAVDRIATGYGGLERKENRV